MSFQYVFNNAQTLSISKRKKVAQTVSRSGSVKSTAVGAQTYEFVVSLPDGLRWSDMRGVIESIEAKDRTETELVQINNPNLSYINGYQGDVHPSLLSTHLHEATSPTTLEITYATGMPSNQYIFKAGDFIQLSVNGPVYNVVNDVAGGEVLIRLNRPIREQQAEYRIAATGQDVTWNLICVNMPTWTIFGYDQVRWNGDFVFAEVV